MTKIITMSIGIAAMISLFMMGAASVFLCRGVNIDIPSFLFDFFDVVAMAGGVWFSIDHFRRKRWGLGGMFVLVSASLLVLGLTPLVPDNNVRVTLLVLIDFAAPVLFGIRMARDFKRAE